ncbi:hypothetical protein CSUB01_09938 [Colletotrichum sublineola]|uniref:DNA/RNA-binding domain-containing protein n=1 Tax=Colletotrichum sublineola TaxID=1173701 RepID=A0A066XB52_COLSU|nr:hypothetical protein CSUB01_09938 [Colletotrichum sublineola]
MGLIHRDGLEPENHHIVLLPIMSREGRPQSTTGYGPMSKGLFSLKSLIHNFRGPRNARLPETRPISQEQLVAEVKGIYAGLAMVESKCIEVDNAQSSTKDTSPSLNPDQWQALIALHRTLLYEHHDFFLASQHPSASPALRRLASKYAMPARMWRYGIHSFLELLRHRLPASLEYMLTFIYLAYSMMALLYETVPTFEDSWIECLGDLGRYRMAIEDDNTKDREVWTSVSRHWYSKASDKAPTTGRMYHHLAILARPNALQQLFYYTKSLCVPNPFSSARESIMTLFDPHLNGTQTQLKKKTQLKKIDAAFIRAHGVLFSGKSNHLLAPSVNEFVNNLDGHIAKQGSESDTKEWLENSQYIAIVLGCALLEYGSESNAIMMAIKTSRTEEAESTEEGAQAKKEEEADRVPVDPKIFIPNQRFLDALDFVVRTHKVVFRRFKDPNVNPYLHVTLSFLYHMSHFPTAMGYIEEAIPWKLISLMLNEHLKSCSVDRIESEDFPRSNDETPRPLPEDFAQRGLLWVEKYYPEDFFTSKPDDDERYFERASMTVDRQERCLWLGYCLATPGKWLTYDKSTRQFGVPPQYNVEIPGLEADAPTQLEPGPRTNLENSAHAAAVQALSSIQLLRALATWLRPVLPDLTNAAHRNVRGRRRPTDRAVARSAMCCPIESTGQCASEAMSPYVVRDPDLYGVPRPTTKRPNWC